MAAPGADRTEVRYEELFKTYFSSLCYFAQKYIADLDTCKEVVHTVFVNVWEKRDVFNFDKSAKSYLFTAVYNRSMNYIRDQKKFKNSESGEPLDARVGGGAEYYDHLEAAELESRIWKIINSLPERCKEVFVLNRFEGEKYAGIAARLGISVKTVETQMSKALKILREQLREYIHLFIFILIKFL